MHIEIYITTLWNVDFLNLPTKICVIIRTSWIALFNKTSSYFLKNFANASENTFNFHQLYLTLKPGIIQKFFWKIRKVLENQPTWIVLNQQTIVYSIILKALFKRQKVPKIQKAYLNFLLLKQFALFLQHSQFNST